MSDQTEPHPRFPHLFSPIAINGVTLRNRVGVSAHYAGWWVTDGLPNEAFAAYLEERARGGMALFIIGATATVFAGGPDWMLNIDDRIIPPYRMLAEAGHRHGAKVFAQLLHLPDRRSSGDEQTAEPVTTDFRVPVVPLTRPLRDTPNRTPEQLQALAETFGVAAARVRNAGLDGVELHAHEGFLFYQFLSPRYNDRTDEYSGPLENRMRFMVQTLQAMRDAVGADFPLGVRISVDDQEEGGNTIENCLDMVERLTELNLVDYINCTVGDYEFHHGPMARPSGEWLPFVGRIKQVTNLPVLHAGRITTPDTAEQALAEGKLDFVFMTKTHIADPHFVNKVREGRLDDIRFCTRCLQSCIGDMEHMSCVYNPVTSRERQWAKLHRAEQRKKVVVVGAGPAGMEAALTAHGRGHEVVVLEKSERVGGQVHLAAAAPLRANLIRIARFYQRQSAKGLFDVQLNTEVGVEEIVALAPDVVIVATGSVPVESALPGSDHVWTTHDALTHEEIWKCRRVVVLDRYGCMEALAVADFLTSEGVTVQFLTPFSEVVPYIDPITRSEMLRQMEQRNITFHLGDEVVAEESGEVWVRNTRNAVERTESNIDRIVIAAGARPVNELALALRNRVGEVHTIGDANLPRTIAEATLQGGSVGRIL